MRRLVTTICLAVVIGTTGSVTRANGDPPLTALASSSYYGKFGLDEANDLVVDADGFVYLAGWSESETDLDGFVVKLTPDGSQLVYATRIGGTGFDVAVGLAVDPSGGVVVVGQTDSADFPLANALQADLRGGFDSWVAMLDDAGAIVYATYYGGSSYENATAIAVGPSGAVYVTGSTGSRDLPGAAGAQPSHRGGTGGDAFVAKISPDGSALMYATYLGGTADDFPSDIAVDVTDHAYVVGGTGSLDFPVASPLQVAYGGGFTDGFVTSISPSGAKFVFSTYLGGSNWDQILGVDVDASRRVYVTGMTWSTGFPTQNAYQATHAGGLSDAIVARLAPDGLGVEYATLLGGSGYDVGVRIVADADGHAHVAGETDSPTFPLVGQVQDQVNGTDAFYARLSPDGASLLRSTPLGGSGADVARGLAVAAGGDVWIGGSTDSQNFPVVTAFQPDPGGSIDAFVSRLTFTASSNQPPVAVADDQVVFTAGCDASVTLDGSRSSDPDGDPLQFVWSGPTGATTGALAVVSLAPGLHTFTLTVDDGKGGVASRSVNVTVIDNAGPEITTMRASPNLLWPPNHRMVDVTIDVALGASCHVSTSCQIVDVISSEPVSGGGDDDASPDWEVTGDLLLRLRAERGSSEERVYSITIECVDQSGNTTRRTVTVSVPKSSRAL